MPVDPANDDRRQHPRYSPDPLVPVLFSSLDALEPTPGLIADISAGGARIVAPPTSRPNLEWSDRVAMVVSYSESTRSRGLEGLRVDGLVVRIAADESGYVLHVRFERADDWATLSGWIEQLSRR